MKSSRRRQQKAPTTFAYTGEIVASTPINRVSAKNPPKKIAIFVMSTPGPQKLQYTARPPG
ncbi:hypothetical protein [Pseudomonas brassicacearum]|uniref:hypothetical protein n=1 Tax=Pseudomonas brassicacearum TaxID=930166 RepID=UPI001E438AAA|nr:hypothetical protein [Pseudomonas brassicacearum]